MAVPKRKHSNSRSGNRRSHHAKKPSQLAFCPNPKCGAPNIPHVICSNCGYYMGRIVVQPEE